MIHLNNWDVSLEMVKIESSNAFTNQSEVSLYSQLFDEIRGNQKNLNLIIV